MCVTGTSLRGVLVLLLLLSAHSAGTRSCNYPEILGSYREVIFVQLHSLNLTSSSETSRVRDPCPSGKARGILGAIYTLTQRMLCQSGGEQRSDLQKPLESMEQLIVHHCSPLYLRRRAPCSVVQRTRRRRRKRIRLIRVMAALLSCWQKLQSVCLL